LTNHFIAFGFIDEGLKIHEHLDHLTEELGAMLPQVAPPP
jgi:hypothetical protein